MSGEFEFGEYSETRIACGKFPEVPGKIIDAINDYADASIDWAGFTDVEAARIAFTAGGRTFPGEQMSAVINMIRRALKEAIRIGAAEKPAEAG